MPQSPADDWQRATGGDTDACERMAQVMNADFVESGDGADPAPRLLQVDKAGTFLPADDHVGVLFKARDGLQDVDRGLVERYRLLARLGILKE